MTEAWSDTGDAPPHSLGGGGLITLLDGSTFCISESTGDITGEHTQGWFVRDTRLISRWLLHIDDLPLSPVAVHQPDPFTAIFISRLADLHLADSANAILVTRHRFLDDGMGEELVVRNNTSATITCAVSLSVGADLADVFEVKDGRVGPRATRRGSVRDTALVITRRGGSRQGAVSVRATGEPLLAPGRVTWDAQVPAHGQWSAHVDVLPLPLTEPDQSPEQDVLRYPRLRLPTRPDAPVITTGYPTLAATLRRSVEDLSALRIVDPQRPRLPVIAAGAPWFMALFGRDALLSAWMTLPLGPTLALGTLHTLARYQGRGVDPVSEEQPGRIPHEVRFGSADSLNTGRRRVYYGSADATPSS